MLLMCVFLSESHAFPGQYIYVPRFNCGSGSWITGANLFGSYGEAAQNCIDHYNANNAPSVASAWRWDATHPDNGTWAGGLAALPTTYNGSSNAPLELYITNSGGTSAWLGGGAYSLGVILVCPYQATALSTSGTGNCACNSGYYAYTNPAQYTSCVNPCPSGYYAQGNVCVPTSSPTCTGQWITSNVSGGYASLGDAGNGACATQGWGAGTFSSVSGGTVYFNCAGGGIASATCSTNYNQGNRAVGCVPGQTCVGP